MASNPSVKQVSRFIHLAPSDSARTGIAAYADVLDTALNKYAPSLNLLRLDASTFLRNLSDFSSAAVVWAEIGVNESEIFQALRFQKKIRPDLKRFITIHDPPRFVHSPFKPLESFGKSTVHRALRRIFNLAFEPLILRQALQPNDQFICLTDVGSQALRAHLTRLKFPRCLVRAIPHLLYLDEPFAPRVKTVDSATKIGFFGFINESKGLHILIDAMIHLAKLDGKNALPLLLIHGRATPNAIDYLKAQKNKTIQASLADKILFGDFLSDIELPSFLCSIDALALPYGASPVISASGVLQWARTYGVPVVASQTKAFSALISHQVDGLLLPQNDVSAWTDTLRRLAADPFALQSLSNGIAKRQREATWKSVASLIIQEIGRGEIGLRNA